MRPSQTGRAWNQVSENADRQSSHFEPRFDLRNMNLPQIHIDS